MSKNSNRFFVPAREQRLKATAQFVHKQQTIYECHKLTGIAPGTILLVWAVARLCTGRDCGLCIWELHCEVLESDLLVAVCCSVVSPATVSLPIAGIHAQ